MNKIAAALALTDTQACLAVLQKAGSCHQPGRDSPGLMALFDLPRLVAKRPAP